MTAETIARLAKALHDEVAELAGSQWHDPDVRANYERYARAAIEAMREPTEAMLLAGWGRFAHDEGLATWHDIIDAMLDAKK